MKPTVFSAAGLLTNYCAVRPKLKEAIEDSLAGQPRAQSYDSDGASAMPWCWLHGRPVSFCHREDQLCSGEVVSSNDPTGNAAVSNDQARAHQSEVEKLESTIVNAVERLDFIRGYYLPKTLPTGAERAKLATAGNDACWFCETYAKRYSPPHTSEPTTAGGNLTQPRHCCSSCYFFIVRKEGRAPTPAEVKYFHGPGQGRWPRKHAA